MAADTVVLPSSNAVNGLGTLISGALLELVGVWAGVTVESCGHRDLVESAPLVLVNLLVVEALVVLIPVSDTVNRLSSR